jgi:peptidoglycan/LPS O-acetylase OafA/YrhL
MPQFLNSTTFNFKSNSFDFIRLILALNVVFSHSGGLGGYNWEPHFDMRDWEGRFTNLGTFSVYGFFVISGFLITRSWLGNPSVGDFCIKRFKRIYPGYFVSLLISALVFVPIMFIIRFGFKPLDFIKEYSRDTSQYIMQNLFVEMRKGRIRDLTRLSQNLNFDINGPFWTLIHEIRAYFLVLILGDTGWLKYKKVLVGLAFIINFIYAAGSLELTFKAGGSVWRFKDLLNDYFGGHQIFILFCYFIFGMVFYIFHNKIVWNKWIFMISILGLIIGWKFDIFPIVAPICFTYFVLYSSQILPFKNLAKKIGDLSYGIYIYSWPIQICLLFLGLNKITGNNKIDYLYFASASIILSIFAGYLSWNFVEKKFLRNRKN